ncbi:MAG: hypothetical protein HYV67_02100 [Candidatus Taylorbacteria bacterium]|nr:hypothetical protein [Candidatus Taylorbacteria bacterium]
MHFFYLIVISLSFAGAVFVLAAKIVEIKTAKAGFLSRWSAAADPALRLKLEKIKFFLAHFNEANVRKILTMGTHGLFHLFGTAGLFVAKHYGRFASRLNGKRFLKGGGVVSFFLKNVAESKEKKKDMN